MDDYYSKKLSAERLRLCYNIASRRVKRYLDAEIEFVLDKLNPSDSILELGCGFGRVLLKLLTEAKTVVGIDTACDSLHLAKKLLGRIPACHLFAMNAVELGFRAQQFDLVICIQNGISAFEVNQRELIKEAMRVTRAGGTVLFSSYSENFWEERLEWFRVQSKYGLIGEIDYVKTGNGIIVCKDGFRASTVGPDDFISLTSDFNVSPKFTEVDGSSIFYEILV